MDPGHGPEALSGGGCQCGPTPLLSTRSDGATPPFQLQDVRPEPGRHAEARLPAG